MRIDADRKMFAPLRRGEALSPEAKLSAVMNTQAGGMTPTVLAEALGRAGVVVGGRESVMARITELLENMEQAGSVERIPDGRYRVVRDRPRTS